MEFHIESSALSKQPLIQSGWVTEVCEEVKPGYQKVNTITWDELNKKYNLPFNTLIADCEGALYQILKDEPNMFDSFKKVIVENDYGDISHYKFVEAQLKKLWISVSISASWSIWSLYSFFL